jgi:PAS domain S-box-containing protein
MSPDTIEISYLLDHVGVIIIVIDSDQKVSYINKKGCEILGHNKEDILGKNWFDNFLPENVRAEIKTVFRKLMSGEIELAEYFDNFVLTKAGHTRIIGWHNTILKNDTGTIIGTLSWGEDITVRSRNEKERQELIQDLQDRVSELKSMKLKLPICSWNKDDIKEAIKRHYHRISREGKCSERLNVLKMAPQVKK